MHEISTEGSSHYYRYRLVEEFNQKAQDSGDKEILFTSEKIDMKQCITIGELGYKRWRQFVKKATEENAVSLIDRRFISFSQCYAYPIPPKLEKRQASFLLASFKRAAKRKGKNIAFEMEPFISKGEKALYIWLTPKSYKEWLGLHSSNPNASTMTVEELEQELYGDKASGEEDSSRLAHADRTQQALNDSVINPAPASTNWLFKEICPQDLLPKLNKSLEKSINEVKKGKKRYLSLFARQFTREMIDGKVCFVHIPRNCSEVHRDRLTLLFNKKARELGVKEIFFEKKEINKMFCVIIDKLGYKKWRQLVKKNLEGGKVVHLSERKFIPVQQYYAYPIPPGFNKSKIAGLLNQFNDFAKINEKKIAFKAGELINKGEKAKYIYITAEKYKEWLLLLSNDPSQNASTKTIEELEQELYGDEASEEEEASVLLPDADETQQLSANAKNSHRLFSQLNLEPRETSSTHSGSNRRLYSQVQAPHGAAKRIKITP